MYEKFEQLLKERGVRTADVAKATGIGQSSFTDWKKGRSTPKTDKLQLIAEYFGVPLETFTGKDRKQIEVTDLFSTPSFDEDADAVREIFENALNEALTGRYRLTDDEKKIILAYRIAPESTKEIIRKILDIKKDNSESLTEAG